MSHVVDVTWDASHYRGMCVCITCHLCNSCRPVVVDGRVQQYVGTVDDVTRQLKLEADKKRAERAALVARGRAEAERDTATYLFHELRTDLQVVETAIVFDGGGAAAAIPAELKQAARASVLHCNQLVENVMDLSKFKAGRMALAAECFSLRAVAEEVGRTMRVAFPGVPQSVACAAAYRVRGSRRHLKQALQNLMPVPTNIRRGSRNSTKLDFRL